MREKKREKSKRHADRKKKLSNPINSRASLYPVSSLSLSRAPCLLEENELPVAQWQEYDKAFTCVSVALREGRSFCVFFVRRRRQKKKKKKKQKEGAPSRSFPLTALSDPS